MSITDPHGKVMSDEERKAAVNRLQQDLTIYQSDALAKGRELENIRMELRVYEKKLKELTLEIQSRQKDVKKKENDLFVIQEEIKHVKKRINVLL